MLLKRPVTLAGRSSHRILQHGYLKRSSSWASDCHMGIFTSDSSCDTDLKGFLEHGRYGEASAYGLSHYYALAVFSCFAMVPMTVAALVSVYDAKGEQEYNKLKMIAHACGSFFTCLTWILMATLYTRKSSNYCYTSLKSEFDLYWSFGFIVVVSVLQGVLALLQYKESVSCPDDDDVYCEIKSERLSEKSEPYDVKVMKEV
eukprot:TRINITY_DN1307_c4_g1_i6.p1 TRINITY_DN1307_c4_g1~~TRINITY_DN1307_c4_g1_i6.p1  ORF type:complete len:202 (+),score=37.58 TRINITY_DN1307_c4_g1_i6:74-679(+)